MINRKPIDKNNIFCPNCGESFYDCRVNVCGDFIAEKKSRYPDKDGIRRLIAGRKIYNIDSRDIEKLGRAKDLCHCNISVPFRAPISLFVNI